MRIKINDGFCEWEYDVVFDNTPAIDDVIVEVCYRLAGLVKRCRITKESKYSHAEEITTLVKVKNKIWEYDEDVCSTK